MIKRLVNLEVSKGKQNIINIVASVLNLVVTTLISFVLSPYIVRTIGVEANGFVSLANQFISYVTLARTALNSMGSRFIMMAYYNNDEDKVEKYYSSLFFADLILALVLGCVGAACVWKLEYVLQIPKYMVTDVKWLFALLFLNFVIATIITVWNTAPYIKNRLYLDSITSALNAFVRALVIAGLFICLEPTVSFVGIGTLVGGLIGYILHYFYKKHLFPNLNAKLDNFSWTAIKELLSSGVWNSISSLGTILVNGLDLLVANLFVGATGMGVLSVAKTMPSFVSTLNSTIAGVFTPSLIIDYSQGRTENIVKTVRQSAKMIAVVCSLPLGFLIVYGKEFYILWQPSQEAQILHILSVITIFGRVFFTGMEPLFNVFTVVNKVKQNSIVTIANGLVSILITYILVRTTNLGIYAIAGVSVACCFIKNVGFVIPFSAKYLNLKWTTFYSTLIPSVLCCGILCLWGTVQKIFMPVEGWLSLIITGVIFASVGFVLTTLIVLGKSERKYLFGILKSKIRRS